jgi:hypothetical protein
LPEIATDPNGDTTIGFLPARLDLDSQKQIRRMLALHFISNSITMASANHRAALMIPGLSIAVSLLLI